MKQFGLSNGTCRAHGPRLSSVVGEAVEEAAAEVGEAEVAGEEAAAVEAVEAAEAAADSVRRTTPDRRA